MNEQLIIFWHGLEEILDLLSISALVATLLGWLPTVSLLLTIIWMALRIYESPTVQRHLIIHHYLDKEDEADAENLEERD